MGNHKRVMISLPHSLLQEVDGIVERENLNRSQLIREAMRLYIAEKKRREIRERMKEGYMEMANLNLELANEGILIEGRCLTSYEVNLAECE